MIIDKANDMQVHLNNSTIPCLKEGNQTFNNDKQVQNNKSYLQVIW